MKKKTIGGPFKGSVFSPGAGLGQQNHNGTENDSKLLYNAEKDQMAHLII